MGNWFGWFSFVLNILVFLILLVFLGIRILVFFLPYLKVGFFIVEWDFLVLKMNFYFNRVLFSLVLFLITISVLIFSTYYLNGELYFDYYYFVLLIFVGRIFGLICRNGGFSMLVRWDLLGISSFFLVLFYNNWDSCRGAMNTVLTNRLGDFFLFVFFSGIVFRRYYFLSILFFCNLVFFMLLSSSFTKRAQFPFRG